MKPVSCQFNRLKINSERKTLNKYIDVLSANYQLICFLLRLRRREQCSRRNCRHSSELITNRNEKNKTKQKQKQKQKTKTTQFHFLSTRSIERTRNNLVAPTFRAPPVQMRALDLHARPNKQVDRTMSNRRRQQQRRQRRRRCSNLCCRSYPARTNNRQLQSPCKNKLETSSIPITYFLRRMDRFAKQRADQAQQRRLFEQIITYLCDERANNNNKQLAIDEQITAQCP